MTDQELVRSTDEAIRNTRWLISRMRDDKATMAQQCAASRTSMAECLRLAELLGQFGPVFSN
jgi:hypothetical protein